MPEDLQVDVIGLHMTSAQLRAAAEEHAADTARHMADFTDAVSRWRGGASLAALKEVAERWETRHAQRQKHVHTISQDVTHAANAYAAADGGSSEVSDSTPNIGNNPGSGSDVGLNL